MWSTLAVLSCVFTVGSLNPLIAPVGGNVTLRCSHFFASGNMKYFCKESCDEHILIQSKTGENPTRRGRYTLQDEGSDFSVTISGLRSSDSGTYVCAVDRSIRNTYGYVTLRVIEVSTPAPATAVASKPPAKGTTRDTTENMVTSPSPDISPETMRRSGLSRKYPLVYVGAGLGALVLILTVAVFAFIKLKHKQKRCSSTGKSSTCQSDYVNYSTQDFTARSNSLHYSSVEFIKKPDCNVKNSETEPDQTLYSSVKTQRPIEHH